MKHLIAITLTMILLAGTGYAQESNRMFQIAYENALIDSAHRYEKLKPTFFNLKTAYEYQGKEVEGLKNALRMSELQNQLQKQSFTASITEERKKRRGRWWKGFGAGFAAGFLVKSSFK